MPVDAYVDLEDDEGAQTGPVRRFADFDCPDCNANNPCDPPLGDGDEVLCNYCGAQFKVKVSEEGRVKFKEI